MESSQLADTAVSIVIPNWNGLGHLPTCLDAVASQTRPAGEVILVDSGSTDGSIEFVTERYPWVKVISLGQNLGFPAAANAGIRSTNAPYIALLNNDTRADEDWLRRLVAGLESDIRADFAASKLLALEDPAIIDSAGHGFDIARVRGTDLGQGRPAADFSRPAWVFGACAAAALYKRTLFDDIGLFDEDFFLAYEDVDIDMRAQAGGHRCIFVPGAVVYHLRSASHDPLASTRRATAIRNRIWVVGKGFPLPLLTVAMVAIVLLTLREFVVRGFRSLVGRCRAPTSANPRGPSVELIRETWRGIRTLPEKRRATRTYRRTGTLSLIRAMRPQELAESHLR